MCGISGFLDLKGVSSYRALKIGKAMSLAMEHRGPDGSGLWFESNSGVVFAHRRLSILDVSDAGSQPMESPSGRYVISYNGEIYNHMQLRKTLELANQNLNWNGHSDTETIAALFDVYGVQSTLQKLVGMFAIAIWDKSNSCVILARDKMGEKPLYYGRQKNVFFFASELKSIRAHSDFVPSINRKALGLFMKYGHVPQPYCIYDNISKLPPGHYIVLNQFSEPVPYWSLEESFVRAKNITGNISETEVLDNLEFKLSQAVASQMNSDVPLGAFLSGGIDSSLIASLMQEKSASPIKTFSIGFDEPQFNEAPFAKSVAAHIGTDHQELYLSGKDSLDVVPQLSKIYDEPFADSSQIPTFLLSKLSRDYVTVALTGDGGDELFGGYNRHVVGSSIWSKLAKVPLSVRVSLSDKLLSLNLNKFDEILAPLFSMLPAKFSYNNLGEKLYKLSIVCRAKSKEDFYDTLTSCWKNPAELVLFEQELSVILNSAKKFPQHLSIEEGMMYLDTENYLPNDILVKVDRAAMAVSLETRIPFLDAQVVEEALQMPLQYKIRHGKGKWCLRQLLNKRVPEKLTERPKMGFGAPVGSWLRGPLKDWAEQLLDRRRLEHANYLNADIVRNTWKQHKSMGLDQQHQLWSVLVFESWRDEAGL